MPPANRTPYTQVLSALRKTDLVRLCVEFRLPPDGSVVALRHRLKDYLNLHREALYRNARYNALFPRHRRVNQGPPAPPPSSRSPSPALSYVSQSQYGSDDSWHGIGGDPVVNHAHDPQPLPPHQEPIPGVHEQPHFPEFPEGSPPFIPPQHSRSPSFSRRDSPALMANIGAGCKYLLTPGHDYYVLPFSRHYTVSHTLFMRLFFAPLYLWSGTMQPFIIETLCSLGHYAVLTLRVAFINLYCLEAHSVITVPPFFFSS
jgi:hypothetical protein